MDPSRLVRRRGFRSVVGIRSLRSFLGKSDLRPFEDGNPSMRKDEPDVESR